MQTSTLKPTQSTMHAPALSMRFVRSAGAADAQEFAQIMQAFDADSELTESIEQSQYADRANDQADQENQEQIQSDEHAGPEKSEQSQDEQESSESGSEPGPTKPLSESQVDEQTPDADPDTESNWQPEQSIDSKNQGTQATDSLAQASGQSTQKQQDTGVVQSLPRSVEAKFAAPAQGTQAHEISLRLLENQSEQAKLTIKGVVRSLTHAADTDLTTIAVHTRLGRETHQAAQSSPLSQPTQFNTEASQPTPKSTLGEPLAMPVPSPMNDVIPGQSVDASRLDMQSRGSSPMQSTQPNLSTQDPGSNQAQVTRGQSASMAAQIAEPVRVVDQASNKPAQAVANVLRSPSSMTSRAITGVESAGVANQQFGSGSNALVEKMKTADIPNESKRAGVLAQVQRGLASLMRSGDGQMTLKLTPGHLGDVRIRVKTQGDGLSVRFETSTKEAAEHLQSSVKELSVVLRAKGVRIEQIQIDPPSNNQESGQGAQTDSESSGSNRGGESERQSRDQGAGQDSESHDHAESHTEAGNKDTASDSIWTELGLDATA